MLLRSFNWCVQWNEKTSKRKPTATFSIEGSIHVKMLFFRSVIEPWKSIKDFLSKLELNVKAELEAKFKTSNIRFEKPHIIGVAKNQ